MSSTIITFHLDGVSKDFDLGTLLVSEARDMKKMIGLASTADLLEALQNEDPDATAFAWWLANKRAGTPLEGKFLDLDFNLNGLLVSVPKPPEADSLVEEAEVDPDAPFGSSPEPEAAPI